jgi:hypothetical protein
MHFAYWFRRSPEYFIVSPAVAILMEYPLKYFAPLA